MRPEPGGIVSDCAQAVCSQQTILPLHELDYDDLDSIGRTLSDMLMAARALGDAGCRVMAKTGTPFAWAGLDSEADARARGARLADAAGVPVVMAGTAIIDALRGLGVERVAIATPYTRGHSG